MLPPQYQGAYASGSSAGPELASTPGHRISKQLGSARLLVAVPTLLIASVIVFSLARLIPGDVVTLMMSDMGTGIPYNLMGVGSYDGAFPGRNFIR